MAAVLAVFLTIAASAAFAAPLLPDGVPGDTPADTSGSGILAEQAAAADIRIAERIRGIFAQVPSLSGISLRVEDGVVSLSGMAADAEAISRAEEIASRVDGVATVENNIERDLTADGTYGLGPLGEKFAQFTRLLPLIGAAALVGLLIALAGHFLASLTGLWQRLAPNGFLAELIGSSIRFVFLIGALVIALDMIGAGALMGAVLGGAGVIGIALGFAMRDSVENYVASLMLSLRQPFRANDHVVIDSFEGLVIRLTSRATILMTLEGNHLRIPNSQVFKAVIVNFSTNPQRRFDFVLGVDADDDPTIARKVGVDALRQLPFVLARPEPQGRIVEVGDSSIVIRFLAWVDQQETDWGKARSEAIPAVMQALEAAGIIMPEPIYRLRFDGTGPVLPLDRPQPEATEGGHAAAPVQRRKPAAPPQASDTLPASEVSRMVEAERAGAEEKDLLDPRRPVE